MKSNELRVGNLVWDNYGGIYKVVNINSEGFDYIDAVKPNFKAIGRYELESLEPIPITEEWLKRFGFEILVGWLDVWRKDGFDRFDLTAIGDGFYFNDTQIEFVHQLQNAFFYIEQTELTHD